jgi:hypothetical protein
MNLNEWTKFDGTAYARSSKDGASGPPGETEIGKLNPERANRIRAKAGWSSLEPGTLNLRVDNSDIHMLATLKPAFSEFAPTYPDEYSSIPKKRVGYWYYNAEITARKGKEFKTPKRVLLRRAINPCSGVIEVLSPFNIRKKWGIKDGDKLSIKALTHTDTTDSIFTTKGGKPANIIGQHHGATAFLVMNGPSLKTIDRGPLKFVHTMCVNNGPKALMPKLRPNFWTLVDGPDKFLYTIWNDPTITKFAPTSARHKPLWNSDTELPAGITVDQCPNVIYYERNTEFKPDEYLTESSVNWGNSKHNKDENGRSGCRSCMLAAIKILYLAGFRKIYLLGADFSMDADNHYAFDQDRKRSAIRNNQTTYKQLNWRFERMRKHFSDCGLEVYNCNPDSGLTAFDHVPYESALEDALSYTHDWKAYVHGKLEKTAGLYESKWYVCPQCNHNARYTKDDIADGGCKCICGFVLNEDNRRKYLKDRTQGDIAS